MPEEHNAPPAEANGDAQNNNETPQAQPEQNAGDSYNTEADTIENSISGHNNTTTIIKGVTLEEIAQYNESFLANFRDFLDSRSENSGSQVRTKRTAYTRPGVPDNTTLTAEQHENAKEIPKTAEALELWYYKLSEYDQCIVQAVAVFHGGTLAMVSQATRELYETIEAAAREDRAQYVYPPSIPETEQERKVAISLQTRMNKLHMLKKRSEGVDRFYWIDVDAKGNSQFDIQLLQFIANEVQFSTQRGQNFLNKLKNWAIRFSREDMWLATRALGVVWLHNRNYLYTIADNWARRKDDLYWQRTASMLLGAYEADCTLNSDDANHRERSTVLSHLRYWVKYAHGLKPIGTMSQDNYVPDEQIRFRYSVDTSELQILLEDTYTPINDSDSDEVYGSSQRAVNLRVGYTTAITYASIGTINLDIALHGLNDLLRLPYVPKNERSDSSVYIPINLYYACVQNYADLAVTARYSRQVFRYLAQYVEELVYKQRLFTSMDSYERQLRKEQRTIFLSACISSFFLIVSYSFDHVRDVMNSGYELQKSLPEQPSFENARGCEVILSGIVSQNENEWRTNVKTLLCGAILEKNDTPVFFILEVWAKLVLEDQSKNPDGVRMAYVDFLVGLGIMVNDWYTYLQEMGRLRNTPSRVALPPQKFKRHLERWQMAGQRLNRKRPLGGLAQEVLEKLPF